MKQLREGDIIGEGCVAYSKIEEDRECTVEVKLMPCSPSSGECYTIIPIIQYINDETKLNNKNQFEKYFLTVYTRDNDSEFTFIPDNKSW